MSKWCEFKIERMYGFKPESVSAAEAANAVRDLPSMSRWHGLQIYPDAEPAPDGHWQFPRLSVGWHEEGHGYVVQCQETVDCDPFLLATSPNLSEPEIYIELGGQSQELWPKQLYVPYSVVMQALDHFLTIGLQEPSLAWIALSSFARRRVTPRPHPR